MKYLIAAAYIFSSGSALASAADEAFKAGQFAQSAIAARTDCAAQIEQMKVMQITADGLSAIKRRASDACALAARATLTVAAYQTNNRAQAEKLISTAITDANTALAQTPNHVEATLQGAIALGYSAKLVQSPGIAKEAKKLMDRAVQLAPNNGFAAIALAGWNGESVADIGSFLAGTVLGAKKEAAIKYYEQALKLDPASPSFPVFYAFNLYRLDDKKYAARVTQLLGTAVTLKPRDGFEAMNIAHARDVLSALKSGDSKRAKALIKQYQPFGVLLKK
jgi:tetratricopeptide (TPR) repeat protein